MWRVSVCGAQRLRGRCVRWEPSSLCRGAAPVWREGRSEAPPPHRVKRSRSTIGPQRGAASHWVRHVSGGGWVASLHFALGCDAAWHVWRALLLLRVWESSHWICHGFALMGMLRTWLPQAFCSCAKSCCGTRFTQNATNVVTSQFGLDSHWMRGACHGRNVAGQPL